MGTLVGHVLPGLAFLALGLWHLFNNIKLFCLRPNIFYSSVWFPVSKIRYLELYFIMFSSSASISNYQWSSSLDLESTSPLTQMAPSHQTTSTTLNILSSPCPSWFMLF
uniref:Uncharacterized protein n=1 Tax=Brassica oleracea TaxID=3712 RepID=A0A3P6BGR0_BRAOL|nr:unnamed protein product [Brassica oleracea]